MELYDLTRYFHNVRNDKGEICPILGEDELSKKTAIIRNLKSGDQQEIKFDEICNYIKKGNK